MRYHRVMIHEDKEFLFELLSTPSPSGWESSGQKRWADRMREISDSVDSDAYGSAWAKLAGTGGSDFTLMLEAHADEIGFIVKHIDEKGFLTMSPIGGSDRTIAAARKVRIFGSKGEVIGIFGNTAIHLRNTKEDKVPEWKDLFLDVGASSADEVAELGIRVGHPAIYVDQAEELSGNRLVGRALDNRISGYMLTRVFHELHEGERPFATTLAVNAIQEELGGFGAKMASYRLFPNAAICFDVTHATDTPGIDQKSNGKVELGKGPTVAHGMANHPTVVARLIELAEKENIPLQHEAISTTTRTDTDSIFIAREGIPSALISIPMRYMHSPTELIDFDDVEAAAKLTVAFVRSISKGEQFWNKL